MIDTLLLLIPVIPASVALLLGILQIVGNGQKECWERWVSGIVISAQTLTCFMLVYVFFAVWTGNVASGSRDYGVWITCGDWKIRWQLTLSVFNLGVASVFALLILVAMRFSVNYLHREPGYLRVFSLLALFAAAMMLLLLGANAFLTFAGWELVGLTSYALIAFSYHRITAANNSTRVFLTNRIGDAGFLLLIVSSSIWLGTTEWQAIATAVNRLNNNQMTLISLGLVLAAFVKSAQIPFSPWLTQALEGPTPTSAIFYGGVMVHAGIFIVIQAQDLLQQVPFVMHLMLVVGCLSLFYSIWVGLSVADIKTSHAIATIGQLGIMFICCGLSFWTLATWHMLAHAIVRSFLMLSAPGIMLDSKVQAVTSFKNRFASSRVLYRLSLQRFWLEELNDHLLVRPFMRLTDDMAYFDQNILSRIISSPIPLIEKVSAIAEKEEDKIGAKLNNPEDTFASGSGLAAQLTVLAAELIHQFEQHFILYGLGRDSIQLGRRMGQIANRFEQLLLKPRYIILFVLICLILVLGGGA